MKAWLKFSHEVSQGLLSPGFLRPDSVAQSIVQQVGPSNKN